MAWKKGQSGNPSGRTVEENRPFLAALTRAIKQDELANDAQGLRAVADALLKSAKEGEPWAIKELADRTDGRPVQPIAQSGDMSVTVTITRFSEKQ